MGSRQDATGAQFFDRPEIEVLEDGSRAPGSERGFVARNNREAVTKDAVGETRRGLFEEYQVHPAPRGGFELRGKSTEIDQVEGRLSNHPDGDVNIVVRMRRSPHA